jgi:hypothetical protein
MDERWTPGLHDHSPAGWLVTAGYLAAGAACLLRGKNSPAPPGDSRVWLLLAAGMFFLAINKQLDLQSALRFAGRDWAEQLGVYRHKALIRLLFIVFLAATGLAVAIGWRKVFFPFFRRNPAVLAGLILTGAYAVLGAADARHLKALEARGLPGDGWRWILEGSGILLVALGPALSRRARSSP